MVRHDAPVAQHGRATPRQVDRPRRGDHLPAPNGRARPQLRRVARQERLHHWRRQAVQVGDAFARHVLVAANLPEAPRGAAQARERAVHVVLRRQVVERDQLLRGDVAQRHHVEAARVVVHPDPHVGVAGVCQALRAAVDDDVAPGRDTDGVHGRERQRQPADVEHRLAGRNRGLRERRHAHSAVGRDDDVGAVAVNRQLAALRRLRARVRFREVHQPPLVRLAELAEAGHAPEARRRPAGALERAGQVARQDGHVHRHLLARRRIAQRHDAAVDDRRVGVAVVPSDVPILQPREPRLEREIDTGSPANEHVAGTRRIVGESDLAEQLHDGRGGMRHDGLTLLLSQLLETGDSFYASSRAALAIKGLSNGPLRRQVVVRQGFACCDRPQRQQVERTVRGVNEDAHVRLTRVAEKQGAARIQQMLLIRESDAVGDREWQDHALDGRDVVPFRHVFGGDRHDDDGLIAAAHALPFLAGGRPWGMLLVRDRYAHRPAAERD